MSPILRHVLAAWALSSLSIGVAFSAEPTIPAAAQDGATRRGSSQIALTQKQVDGWIAVQSAVQAAQPDAAGTPEAKRLAILQDIIKRNGFASIDEYEAVSEHVAKVIVGMDPDKGTYVGAGPIIRKQITEIEADKTMQPAERAAAIDEAKTALAAAEAAPPSSGNISIVSKSYAKLLQAVAGDRSRK